MHICVKLVRCINNVLSTLRVRANFAMNQKGDFSMCYLNFCNRERESAPSFIVLKLFLCFNGRSAYLLICVLKSIGHFFNYGYYSELKVL